ncbi:hypothetical protein AAFF_G00276770 [Aldrovandia affinis]|uniref:SCA7 domain-containing protein n=1 Tax=Aldrovandia affinis TaxID=143900 RepID=A0AAD7RAX7_9TELE|nr:hypothetical protein AAFF_G00276770 [Aldrovandia affinis]
MMAVRERAATAMAALERRVPSLDDFAGQSWSSWIDGAGVFVSEGCDVEESSKNGRRKVETMTLRKEDMSVFGHCPAHDEFYLVVCGRCGQVVKPQALEKHCHALPRPARDGRPPGQPPPPPTLPQHRPARPLKEGVGSSPADRVSQTPPPSDSPPYSLSPGSREPPRPPRLPPPENLFPRRAESGRPPDFPRTYSKTYKKVPRKDCDLDRHCGVMDLDRQKLCTRLLTCNIHSIHQRRQVMGRSRKFDQLVAELKMNSRTQTCGLHGAEVQDALREWGRRGGLWGGSGRPAPAPRPRPSPPPSRLSSEESEGEGPEDPPNLPTTAWHPKPLALCSFGAHALGRSVFTFDRRLHHLRRALSSMVERHISAHLWRKIPQAADVPSQRSLATPPAFSASSYSNSQHSTASTAGGAGPHGAASSLRTSASSSSSSSFSAGGGGREVRLPNCSPGPGSASSEAKGGGGGQPIGSPVPAKAAPPSPACPAPRPRNPVGRPSKQQVRLREAERPSPSPSPVTPHPPEEKPPGGGRPHRRRPPARDRNCSASRTAPISPHGPINGALSPPCAKPRPPEPHLPPGWPRGPPQGHARAPPPPPPPDPSSRGRGGGPGPHRKAVSYDHKGLGKKRNKSSSAPRRPPPPPPPPAPPLAPPPLPRPSKLHRLSAAAHSGFFSWKKDGKGGGASAGSEKKQKPKLHH